MFGLRKEEPARGEHARRHGPAPRERQPVVERQQQEHDRQHGHQHDGDDPQLVGVLAARPRGQIRAAGSWCRYGAARTRARRRWRRGRWLWPSSVPDAAKRAIAAQPMWRSGCRPRAASRTTAQVTCPASSAPPARQSDRKLAGVSGRVPARYRLELGVDHRGGEHGAERAQRAQQAQQLSSADRRTPAPRRRAPSAPVRPRRTMPRATASWCATA